MQTAPKIVEITFGEPPDPKLSSITVVNSSGISVDAGPTMPVPGKPLELEVPLKAIGNGVYTVTWKTVSETDGHLATGAYAFGVGESAANANAHAAKSVVSPPPSILAVVARWLFFIGIMGIVGIASTCLVALRDRPRFTSRMLAGAWLIGAAGVAGIIEAQREAAGISLSALFATSLGTTAIERIVAIVATGLAIVVAWRVPGRHGESRGRGRRNRRCCVDVGRCRIEPCRRAGASRRQPRDPVGAYRRERRVDRGTVDADPCRARRVLRTERRCGAPLLDDRGHRDRVRCVDRNVPGRHRDRFDRTTLQHGVRSARPREGCVVSRPCRPWRHQSFRQRPQGKRLVARDCAEWAPPRW